LCLPAVGRREELHFLPMINKKTAKKLFRVFAVFSVSGLK
jgi:hypothetical protein